MAPSHQSAVDPRGYIFKLPTLGLPDPNGQWVHIKVAIGLKHQAAAALQDPNVSAPRRYACDRYALVDLDYEGACFIIPLCLPELPSPATEVFTLRVRRHLAEDLPCDDRIKLPDGLGFFPWMPIPEEGISVFAGPASIKRKSSTAATPPTEADEKAFWENEYGELLRDWDAEQSTIAPDAFNASWGKLYTSSEPAGASIKSTMKNKEFHHSSEWIHTPEDAFDEDWMVEALAKALIEAVKTSKPPVSREPPTISLQARTGKDGSDEVKFEYAFVFTSGDGAQPSNLKWKPIPTHAWKPGYELIFVNQVRGSLYKHPLSQEDLARSRNAATTASMPTDSSASFAAAPTAAASSSAAAASSNGSTKAKKKKKKAKKQQEQQSAPEEQEEEISQFQAAMGDIFRPDWVKGIYIQKQHEGMQASPPVILKDGDINIQMRIHPADDGDFRSLDYVVRCSGQADNEEVPEDEWKPLPQHATKPGAQRHYVNTMRVSRGKRPFSKEEWPPAPAARF